MMSKLITACLIIVGLINFIPVIGIFSAAQIEQGYGITLVNNNVEILLKHRALLFGLLGGLILYSAFVSQYRTIAMLMGGVSMLGYSFFVLSIGGYNESIYKILIIDAIGILFLMMAILMKFITSKKIN